MDLHYFVGVKRKTSGQVTTLKISEIQKIVENHYLFKNMNETEMAELLLNAPPQIIPAGRLLWSKREKVPHIVVLLKGTLKISLLDPMGNEFAVKHITPVDSLGDASIFEDKGQLSDVVAIEESTVIFVKKSDIIRVLNNNAKAAAALCGELSRRIDNLTTELELQVFSRGTVRILYRLLQLKAGDSQEIRITHSQLAELVGMSRERLTLALGDLEELGYLKRKRGRIIIRDFGKIKEIIRDFGQ